MSLLIVLTALMFMVQAALGGSILVLRRSVMLTDAMAHSVLPGLVIGYLISGSRSGPEVLLFAGISSFLAAFLIEKLSQFGGVWFEVSTGFVFTSLFAFGILLVTALGGNIDLDPDCILYGELLYVPFRYSTSATWYDLLPIPMWNQIWVGLAWIWFALSKWKQLKCWAFDEDFSRATQIPVAGLRRWTLGLTSMTIVVGFDAFGAILVLGFFILPASTAWLLAKKWGSMLSIAAIQGFLSVGIGYAMAFQFDLEPGPCMVCISGLLFGIVAVVQHIRNPQSGFRPTH